MEKPSTQSEAAAEIPAEPPADPTPDLAGQSRLQLLWSVLVFQLKLVADGFRDVLLVPVSLLAALLGLVAGGSEPARLFEQVLRFGRRTESWINLFGTRDPRGTADELLDPLKERVFSHADNHPMLNKAGQSLNRSLDSVNKKIQSSKSSDDP